MLENFRSAIRGIWTHKLRSFLTMLGIIIGIAAIIAIVSTIEGTNEQIKANLIGSGSNLVKIELCQESWPYEMEYNGIPQGVGMITDEVLESIEGIENVVSASRYVSRNVYSDIFYKNSSMTGGYVRGVDLNYINTCGYIMKSGRDFIDSDFSNFRKVCIIDDTLEKSLLQGDKSIGSIIEIKGDTFTVIGVCTMPSTFEPTINTMDDYYTYVNTDGGNLFIPYSDWPIAYMYDEPQNIAIHVKSTDDMTSVGKTAADILNNSISPSDTSIKYKAQDLLEQATELQQLSKSTNSMLIWIAAISLLVGGIGVMNIMLVSVTERTGEIGLKKAIGARKGKILGQFLTEAAMLTSIGGILGVVAGITLAEIISAVSETPVAISVPAAILAVAFSMVIGIVFGMLPSYQAANLNPIDALRHE